MLEPDTLEETFETLWARATVRSPSTPPHVKKLFSRFFFAGADCCFDLLFPETEDGDGELIFDPEAVFAVADELDAARLRAFAEVPGGHA